MVLFIPEMTVSLFSVSALEIGGFGVAFFSGCAFLYLEVASPDTTVLLGVRHERLYRLLGQPMVGSSGFLDSDSVLVSKSEQVAQESELIWGTRSSSSTLRGLNRYEMTQMAAPKSMSPDQRSTEVAATTTDEMMELETDSGGDTRSTSHAKWECYIW